MPRFYFDVRDGGTTVDDVGSEFPDLRSATKAAIALLPDIAKHDMVDKNERMVAVTVRDVGQHSVFHATLTLHCSELT